MKFLQIELENIFAYAERTVFDLGNVTRKKNIVLLWGRNGMGKTSFLSSIKLLFLGSNDQKLRRIGFPPRTLGHRQYVLGDGGSWSGLINSRARRLDSEARARVRIVWETDSGGRVSAERQWMATPTGYRETLVVDDGEARLTNEPAEERLSEFLPRDFVDFFFFDGEDIKALSESEGRKAVDFDRVLRISFITALANELVQLATERQRAGLPLEVQREIVEAEGEITRCQAIQAAAQQQITNIEDQIVGKRSERRQLMTRRENLRSGASSAEREALESKRQELKDFLERQSADLRG
jgi:DNA sulfur modification protein DndD